ncbi:hypothetical protein CUMW_240080 [Citrus unshiu]|nr:hypothetical protein CUMW_240080 [Citrus unshiu]
MWKLMGCNGKEGSSGILSDLWFIKKKLEFKVDALIEPWFGPVDAISSAASSVCTRKNRQEEADCKNNNVSIAHKLNNNFFKLQNQRLRRIDAIEA